MSEYQRMIRKNGEIIMQKIIINRLGPVEHSELDIKEFMVFTGPQASGKSTIAKSIFFFKNVKNVLFNQLRKKCLLGNQEDTLNFSVKNSLIRDIRSDFLQTFGSTWCMDKNMSIRYDYAEDIWITISLKPDPVTPNYIWIELSPALTESLQEIEREFLSKSDMSFIVESEMIKSRINMVFHDEAEVVYIPAGRSMITLLSTQLNYLYSAMDDTQKKNIDYCTQNYLEKIMMLKPSFSQGVEQMIREMLRLTDMKVDREILYTAAELMKQILNGEYRNVDGEERLQVEEGRYVKINFASSGQQEAVWILNVLFYYLLNNKKTYFIIEEPESHLFPNAQKLMTEFISLARGRHKNQIFITTHSPYILGTINNLLYADNISKIVDEEQLNAIVNKSKWISFSSMSAFFIQGGKVSPCMDEEFKAIENEVIDGVSEEINKDYEKMVLLKEKMLHKEGR
ncbi:MAG: AAA family ATPase [Roseburia sp.]|uniref:AAA family ATPase n=1 Tax=Roseburia hominis TaxID=301301 RepID=UPI001F265DB3|nr:AAA family ATPase [Roseburia hominis]MCI5712713.1 ATP-binding protein [Lachnospiraceae bacterium]